MDRINAVLKTSEIDAEVSSSASCETLTHGDILNVEPDESESFLCLRNTVLK